MHLLLCLLILQQGFAFTVQTKTPPTNTEAFESYLIEILELVTGHDIDLGSLSDEHSCPQDSDNEKETAEQESKEDKECLTGTSSLILLYAAHPFANDECALSHTTPGVITPPPEHRA